MIEIYGKEYEIKYPINTLCLMTEDGIDVLNIQDLTINVITIRDLFYYGLKYDNKKITKNQAGDLIDGYLEEGHTFRDLIEEVMNALAKSLGKKKAEESDNEEPEGEGK